MKVISLCDHKGGVGKTSSAAAIAQGLATSKKNKVLLVDADAQGTATTSAYGVTEIKHTLYDVIKGAVQAKDAIIRTDAGDIIPYSKQLANLDIELNTTNLKKMQENYRLLRTALEPLADTYTHIIIDTAPGVASLATWQALTASTGVLIPIICSPDNFDNLKLTLEDIEIIKESTNSDLQTLGVFFTQHTGNTNIMKQFEDLYRDTCKAYGVKLLKASVRRAVAVQESHALALSLFEYAPKATATEDYQQLIKELKL